MDPTKTTGDRERERTDRRDMWRDRPVESADEDSDASSEEGAHRTLLERGLGLVADVRHGEAGHALLLGASIFLLLVAYYLLKVAREPLILTASAFGLSGATLKSAAACGMALLLIVVVPAYSSLASRMPRMRLINVVTLIFVACLGAFFLAAQVAPIGPAFFIFVGIFNVTAIAQFWAFCNDLYTPGAGKRLFAIIAFGQTMGAIVGADLARRLVAALGVYALFPVAAAILVASTALANVVNARAGQTPVAREKIDDEDRAGGFRLVWRNQYLLGIAFLVLILNTVNSNGEFILGETVVKSIHAASTDETRRAIGAFYGGYFSLVNIVCALLQLLLVSRIIKHAGVGRSLLVLPTISLLGYGIIGLAPALMVMKSIKIAENGVDYSLQNTTQQALYLPTARAEKYKAKQAIDTFFVRFGDVVSLATVAVVTEVLGLGVQAMAIVNVFLALGWWSLAYLTSRRNRRLVHEA
jgi:AAA family ATP:ADP antiporter